MKERHIILFKQLETYRKEILDSLNGISGDAAEIVPNKFNNNKGGNCLVIYRWNSSLN